MKAIRFILIQIFSLFAVTMSCIGQSKGEIVAKNGIYAEIEVYPKDNWPISMTMFFLDGDTIYISLESIESTIKSILKNGDFVSVGWSNTWEAVTDIFNCTRQQGYDAERKLNDDLNQIQFEKKFEEKNIKKESFAVVITYTQMQAFFLKTSYEKFGGDPVSSNGIPLEYVPDEYLILLSIVNTDRPDEINIEVLN